MALLVTLIAFGIGVTLLFVVVRIARHLGKRAEQRRQDAVLRNPDNRVEMLYSAAIDSDAEFRRCLDVVGVNARNWDGNSALHLAYYDAREDAVARLKAFGADQTRVNHDGLTPAEMAAVPEVERLLEQTLGCMTACRWLNKEQGRPLYEALKRRPSAIYNAALVRVFQRAGHKSGVVCLAVKIGIPGSEQRLALILHRYGTKEMATDFLNSGSSALAESARRWAAANGYYITHTGGHAGARWGAF